MSSKVSVFPGFKTLSDQVFVYEPEEHDEPAPAHHPSVVVVFGWGDGVPKHVAKYTDGFRALFPRAKLVAVLSPISKAMFSDLEQRSAAMTPVIDTIFPSSGGDVRNGQVLLHAMSNTGAINYAATIEAYQKRYGKPLPHKLLILDSTPGSTVMTVDNLRRWGRAMALGTAAWFPWPFVVTQTLWAAVLVMNGCFEWCIGRTHAGALARQTTNLETHSTKDARRLYVYSKEDDLIAYGDIESHAAESKQVGYTVDVELFEGSNHVGHMRMHPEKYWRTVEKSWLRAVGVEC